ncbi:hypothetical protein MICRO11B_500003 [Micrococcus luteus]|nr:hypothetical protein MICRO11B_500003 [Micrococcus luteus]
MDHTTPTSLHGLVGHDLRLYPCPARPHMEPRDGEMLSEAIVSRTPDTLGETAHERSTALKVLLIRCGPHA